jgi:hypothetical protein
MDEDRAKRPVSTDGKPEPRRVRLHRAGGCRREVLPLLGRLAHDRHMEGDEPPPMPSTRPRPRLN